jgi:hypothetical protein
MQSNRHLADPDFRCDLLVDTTGYEQCHDLSLACGQRFVTRSQIGELSFVLQPGAIPAQSRLYRIEKILITQRLGQEFDGSGLHRSHRHRDIAVTGDEDDRDGNVFPGQLLLEVEPAQAGKPDVDDNAARILWALASQEFRGGSEPRGLQVAVSSRPCSALRMSGSLWMTTTRAWASLIAHCPLTAA